MYQLFPRPFGRELFVCAYAPWDGLIRASCTAVVALFCLCYKTVSGTEVGTAVPRFSRCKCSYAMYYFRVRALFICGQRFLQERIEARPNRSSEGTRKEGGVRPALSRTSLTALYSLDTLPCDWSSCPECCM
ncbi:unnamed protein product [Ectocarpus sp. 8 AP-2014]